MDKRHFLRATLASAALPGAALAAPAGGPPGARQAGPTLLTLSGEVAHPNRGRLDPALDQLLAKHGVRFERARSFTYADLAALPAVEIRPTLEYDARPHRLRGPLLSHLLDIAGADRSAGVTLSLRALDGYTVELGFTELRQRAVIVATHDVEFAAVFAERVVLLGEGVVIADGPAAEVLSGGWYFATEVARVLDLPGVVTPEQGAATLGAVPEVPR